MSERIEQRYCIKFCCKLGDTQVHTIQKIQQAFGNEAMGITQIKEWYNRFKQGQTSVESKPRSGRPSTSRNEELIENVRQIVENDRRITINEITEEVGISTGSVHTILTEDLAMRRVSAKFVPKLLVEQQKQQRLDIAQDMLNCANSDSDFMKTIITGDETWVYGYDPETKFQSSQWKHHTSPRPKKARQVRSNVKVMLTCFFDSNGIVHHEYAPAGQTINKGYYLEVMRHLRDAVRRKRPEMWAARNWQLHHDNAPAHSAHLIQSYLAKNSTPLVRHPPYSPDMAPCDFWLFPKLKTTLKGKRFESREEIMRKTTAELYSIPLKSFQRCYQQWQHRWEKCVHSQGEYFEGD